MQVRSKDWLCALLGPVLCSVHGGPLHGATCFALGWQSRFLLCSQEWPWVVPAQYLSFSAPSAQTKARAIKCGNAGVKKDQLWQEQNLSLLSCS